MKSYDQAYLADARTKLGWMFHHGIIDIGIEADTFAHMFSRSDIGRLFERGNPGVISGMSGVEIAENMMREFGKKTWDEPIGYPDLWMSEVYWAGWALAYHQWETGRPFHRIIEKVPFSEIIAMYHPFHEMDITAFSLELERRIEERPVQSRLKTLRENRGWSQSDLSEASGVNIRSIQLYEQKVNNIDKAQARTVYCLASALACSVEDLLEDPTIDDRIRHRGTSYPSFQVVLIWTIDA